MSMPKLIKLNRVEEELHIDAHHESFLFPEDVTETMSFTSGIADTFGAWAEIVDNNAVTFSSKVTSPTHISGTIIEGTDTADKFWVLEISWGASNVIVARMRFGSGSKFVAPAQQVRVRAGFIPTGETVYYRLKCEDTAGAVATAHFRYHYH